MSHSGLASISLCLAVVAGIASAQTSTPAKVDFGRDVLPIFREQCGDCHGPAKQRAGMRLDRRSSVMKSFSRRVVPGSSANSFVYHRLIGDEFGAQMPPTGALRPEQIATIKAWIDQGAEWPDALANEVDLPPLDPKAIAMVDDLRTADLPSFLKAATADPSLLNARGPEGSTPFMYAVLYTDVATLTRLLKMGADPNKRNDANATALMWAATDLGKARLLLDHGADVNARSDDMRTPLMIAARRPGGAPIVKLLLDHGAKTNPNYRPENESSPLIEGLTSGDPEVVAMLLDHGADAKMAGETGLSMAIAAHCPDCVDRILGQVTEKSILTASLNDTVVFADTRDVRTLLDHGADANGYDILGRTPLMYAAISDNLPVDMVKLLINHGADVNAIDRHSKTGDEGLRPLDIARHNGDTPVVKLLEKSGAKPGPLTPVSLSMRRDNTIQRAVQDSIPHLQRADTNFITNSGCVSCHDNSLTAMTMGLARKRGFNIDERSDAAQVQANADVLTKLRDRLHQGFVVPTEDNFSEGILAYQLMGLHDEGYKPDLNTDTAVLYILRRQHKNGEWPAQHADNRPPICLDYIGQTARCMRAVQLYAPRANADEYRRSIRLAANWLANAHSYNNDDRSWRVAGLAWAGTNKAATQQAMKELLAAQRADGGWSDLPTMQSTAYATGKSLVALHIAGLSASSPAYQRGIKLLLRTQQEDGSWYVQTRALGFQPWFDAGFPHAHNQWISAAGTNWAAMALAYALPKSAAQKASMHPLSPSKISVKFDQASDQKRSTAFSPVEAVEAQAHR
ncbi:MAG: ankyrin repeat domain-containing protein [Terracidiphilus sp.]